MDLVYTLDPQNSDLLTAGRNKRAVVASGIKVHVNSGLISEAFSTLCSVSLERSNCLAFHDDDNDDESIYR